MFALYHSLNPGISYVVVISSKFLVSVLDKLSYASSIEILEFLTTYKKEASIILQAIIVSTVPQTYLLAS